MANEDNSGLLADLRKKKEKYERQLQGYRQRHSSNNEKLRRIRTVKGQISAIIETLELQATSQKKHSQDDATYSGWTGNVKNSIVDLYAQQTPTAYTTYIGYVDGLLDELVDLETRYENDNLELLGLIGTVGGWINSVGGEIEKLLN